MSDEPEHNSDSDGRIRRAKRSRKAIIEATLSLYSDGIYVPTAQLVADRSGLGIRTVFRHFSEMEQLFIEGDQMLHDQFANLPEVIPEGDVNNRILQLVNLRADNCERFAPFIRATHAQMWRYPQLRSNYRNIAKIQRGRLFEFVPEFKQKPETTQDAADSAISFESWNRLSHTLKKSRRQTVAVMQHSLTALLDAD